MHQTGKGGAGVDMGQVTQTTNHIGFGNPMWGRESNPGPQEGVNSRVVLARAGKSRARVAGSSCWQVCWQMRWQVCCQLCQRTRPVRV